MDMLSNGYGCIKKYSKALKQSLFDWMLHKFNNFLTTTMSDLPTASTSTASTSSASTSQNNPYMFRLTTQDLDCTTDDSDNSSNELHLNLNDDESTNSNDDCHSYETDDNIDDSSWSSASTTISCDNISNSEISETEKSVLRERTPVDKSVTTEESIHDAPTPILLVCTPYEIEDDKIDEITIDLINVEEHAKRIRELEKEMDYIESTEWMFRPIDSSIR